jgi:putative transposase
MQECLKGMKSYHPDVDILEINHDKDHIHLLVSIPPKKSVGSIVRILKSNTARELKKKFEFLKEVYWGTDSVWSGGYFVSTVGINEEVIRRYIEMQGREDAGQAKLEL